jgi:uncharacterized protein (TIGR03437 family)
MSPRRMAIHGLTTLAILSAPLVCRAQSVISTVAGTGTCCADADGVSATLAYLQGADGLTIDSAGNLYIWEGQPFRIRKVSASGIISTVAGIYQSFGSTGDGGPATSALLAGGSTHSGLAMDSAGNLYISDSNNQRIRKVNTSGIISTVAGNGSPGFSGDNGPATSAMLNDPEGIAVDGEGNLYIADASNSRIRKVSPAGVITTVAGNGNVVDAGDGGPAASAAVDRPAGVTVDSAGNLYIAEGRRIRKVNAAGIISTVAGTGVLGFSGDGGPGASAQIRGANGMAVDRFGNLYFADTSNQRVRKVDTAGIITTVAGGIAGFSGDGGLAVNALLRVPHDVVFDTAGNLYVSDTGNFRIRKISATATPLSASPSSLSFSYTIGGATPASQAVSISSSGAALTFTAAAPTPLGGSWLAVSPATGSTPSTLNVSVTPGNLAAGTYQGAITLTPSGAGATPQSIAVTLTVSGSAAPALTISSVVNASGYQTKLAPGVLFVILGSGLDSASATFTPAGGGGAVDAIVLSATATKLSGLLPSSIAPGTYTLRVASNGQTSAPQSVTVVARSFGIATLNGAGTGPAQATVTNADGGVSLVRFTSVSLDLTGAPAHPGDTLDLSGTGGGADPAGDAGGSSGDQTADGNFIVIAGDRQITPLYAGAVAGSPGAWRISFTLPSDISTDCFAAVQVSAGGELSNAVSIPIAAAGESACSDPQSSPSVLTKLDTGGDIIVAAFAVAKIRATGAGVTQETASGIVARFTPAEWILSRSGPKFDLCSVYDRTYPRGGRDPANPDGSLDAGVRLPVSGPNLPAGFGMGSIATATGPVYSNSAAAGTLASGAYTLTGLGGAQVGAFSASAVFPSSFTVTNWDSVTAIDRSRPLTFNWTGSGFEQVVILASTATMVGANVHIATISCYAPGGLGSYSVPTAALAYLQPAATTGASFGSVSVEAISAPGTFTAPLVGGGQTDIGSFQANLGVDKNIAVQ